MINFKSTIIHIDQLIREGLHGQAEKQLNEMLLIDIPREYLCGVAALARRLSRSEIGVQLLNPVVRPPATKPKEATFDERLEYAACLIRLGIFREAHDILDAIPVQSYPRSLIFRAFAFIARWDFAKSGACLNEFLKIPGVDPYDVLIAKVNLAVGLVFLEDFEKANPLLEELRQMTFESKNNLLFSNTLELAAQVAILSGEYNLAGNLLLEAGKALPSSQTIDAFYLKKDQAILNLFKSKNSKTSIQGVNAIKKEAQSRKFWEQGRDCDYYLAIATRRTATVLQLYFGTPYEPYREKLLSKVGFTNKDMADDFGWKLGSGRTFERIHVASGANSASKIFFNEGQVPQRVFQVLASDYYRPRRIMEIFENVFPDEYFSPKYSVDKIHQGIRRLRAQLLQMKIPLGIAERSGFYYLQVSANKNVEIICSRKVSPLQVKPYLDRRRESHVLELLQKMKHLYSKRAFTAAEFANFHDISTRSAIRHLGQAVKKGWVKRTGQARFVKYRF